MCVTGLRLVLPSFDFGKTITVKYQTGVLLAKLAVETNEKLVCFVCTFLLTSRFLLGSGVRGQIDQLRGLMAPYPPALLG